MALLLMEVLYKHHHSTLTINVALVKSGSPSPLLATKTGPLGSLLAVRSVRKVPLPGPILVVKSGPWGAILVAKNEPGGPVLVAKNEPGGPVLVAKSGPENIMSLLPFVLLQV